MRHLVALVLSACLPVSVIPSINYCVCEVTLYIYTKKFQRNGVYYTNLMKHFQALVPLSIDWNRYTLPGRVITPEVLEPNRLREAIPAIRITSMHDAPSHLLDGLVREVFLVPFAASAQYLELNGDWLFTCDYEGS